ncbi:MAG: hypothetical protein JO107_12230 [Hyphomicrobiales bacterium]|nr:hypothetical protein [Hyphomicrobiales bacterium]
MGDAIDILAVVTRPSFASGLGPIGDHLNLRKLAARRPDLSMRIVELNARPTRLHLDSELLEIEQEGEAPIRLGTAALVLYMPVSFDVEETDLSPQRADDPWPTFTHWQWRAITEYLDHRLPEVGRCINQPLAARRANNKLLQWQTLSAAGFPIPALAVSTGWPRQGALASAATLVRKNLSESGWKAEGVFSPARKARADEPADDLPAIWQQPVEADFEIRCYVFGDEATFVRLERDADVTDVRITNDGRPKARFVEPLPGWSAAMLGATRALGLDYAVIDALPHGDELTILEVNANGVWWFLPDDVGAELEAKFHAWLERLVAAERRARR